MKIFSKQIYLFISFIQVSIIAFAQHDTHHDESHGHNNHLALFVGNTSQHSFDENSFTVGLDYMYFFPKSEHWGISTFGEIIMAEHTEWLFGLPAVYKTNKGFWLRAGPGIELAKDHQNNVGYYFLARVGAGYDFHLQKIVLSPSLDFDGLRKHPAIVLGLNIGFGF